MFMLEQEIGALFVTVWNFLFGSSILSFLCVLICGTFVVHMYSSHPSSSCSIHNQFSALSIYPFDHPYPSVSIVVESFLHGGKDPPSPLRASESPSHCTALTSHPNRFSPYALISVFESRHPPRGTCTYVYFCFHSRFFPSTWSYFLLHWQPWT